MTARRVFPALALFVLTASPALGQPRPMSIVDLIGLPRISDPQVSPDGRAVLFVRSDADWKANKRVTHLWRVASDGRSEPVQMTTGAEGESSPRWSPDSRTIAFVAKRTGDEVAQIYLLATAGGEAVRLTASETAVSSPSWAPDGLALYFLASDPKTADEKARDKAKDDVYAFDEDFKQSHLSKVTLSTKKIDRVTSGDFSVASYHLSRDGTRIAHVRAPNPLTGYADRGEVWVMHADGTHPLQLTNNRITENGAELSPDGAAVLFLAAANASFQPYYNDRIFTMPATGGQPRVLTTDLPYEVERATWSKDGASIYFTANTGVRSELFVVPAGGGTPRMLTRGDHTLTGWDYNDATDEHVFGQDEPANAGDLWVLKSGATAHRVTRLYDSLSTQFRLPKVERIEWKGADGVAVEGLLYYPLDYTPGQRYPLVVQTHGGPASSDKFSFGSWSSYTQVLTAKGYAVLKPNYRGSTGYGDAFLRDMVGHYFKNAHLDVMAGVDRVIAMGLADPDRLAKMGWSAGGHMTNKIVTFTDRFKAASSGAGAANWASLYAQSDVRAYRTPWFGGTPWQEDAPTDLFWDQSPLKYVANVKTPTIFLVGERDVRVPMPQSVEMYRALLSNGVPTRLYVAPREPHGWAELRHELFKVNVELEWFERWVTRRAYTWEKAPGAEKPETSSTTASW